MTPFATGSYYRRSNAYMTSVHHASAPSWKNQPTTIQQELLHAKNNVHIPEATSNAGKRRFSFMASTLWNSLPNEAKKITSQPSFNKYYKSYFSQKP